METHRMPSGVLHTGKVHTSKSRVVKEGKLRLMKIIPSGRKTKKWLAIFKLPDGAERKVHFGQKGARDYTRISDRKSSFFIKDKVEREKVKNAYQARHKKDKISDPLTPAALSWYVLWDKAKLGASISAFKKRFGV